MDFVRGDLSGRVPEWTSSLGAMLPDASKWTSPVIDLSERASPDRTGGHADGIRLKDPMSSRLVPHISSLRDGFIRVR